MRKIYIFCNKMFVFIMSLPYFAKFRLSPHPGIKIQIGPPGGLFGTASMISHGERMGTFHGRMRYFLRISRTPFEFLVDSVRAYLQKTQTNACSDPIPPQKEFALTLYRLAHGTSYLKTGALFRVSEAKLACVTFNHLVLCRIIAVILDDIYVKLPDDWKKELTGFIENYSFPCVGMWDVDVETKLKSYYSFKKTI